MKMTMQMIVMALALTTTSPAAIYSGSLSSSGVGTDGTLVGTEQWSSDALFSWTVSDEDGTGWHYTYSLTVLGKDISHVITEVSDTFESSNILGDVNDPDNILSNPLLDLYGPGLNGNSDPGIPDNLNGIKFDTTGDTKSITWSFFSDRVPVWGDIYAKDGVNNLGGGVKNDVYLYNSGFTAGDTDPDILVNPAASGSVDNHILVPNSLTDPEGPGIPEPNTAILGIIGLIAILRHRSK